jgi:hypothetical protein
MTRESANRILTKWKNGDGHFQSAVITAALIATGDMGPTP